jgi:predicted DNA-binding transcriptional regulator YafY
MSNELAEHDKLAYRLTQILVKLNDGESLDPLALADEFGVHPRTIQRDLNTRFASLALKRVDGCYKLDPVILGKLSIQDIERFANLAGVRGLFPKLTGDFMRELVDRNAQGTLLVKGPHYEDLRGKERLFSLLAQAINARQRIEFDYLKPEGRKSYAIIEPYKLVNHGGIWYLAGKDGDKLKSWTFTKIENLQTLDTFTPDLSVHDTLTKEDGIWLNAKKIEVVLKVFPAVAGYFQRRSLIAHQVIEKELEDGGLIVSCKVAHPNQIFPIVRYWLPNVRIISPEGYQATLEAELKAYLQGATSIAP